MLTANLILSAVGVAALSEPSSNLGGITGSTEIRRYRLMVRTLVFETSNAGSIPANA